jgi:hypothetical protein
MRDQLEAPVESSVRAPTNRTNQGAENTPLSESELRQLMRQRNELAQLQRRLRELAGVQSEHAALQARLQTSGTTNPPGEKVPMPPGYIRRRDAQFVGLATPEASLESFLYAIDKRDTNLLLSVVGGNMGTQMKAQIERGEVEKMWAQIRFLPGARITRTNRVSAGEVEVQVEFMPGADDSLKFTFTDSGWKLGE